MYITLTIYINLLMQVINPNFTLLSAECELWNSNPGPPASEDRYCERCLFMLSLFISRDFIEQHYVNIKKENSRFPILIRECSGIQPKIYARYGRL